MTQIKAIITDYIGTLTNARHYSMEDSISKLHLALVTQGFDMANRDFKEAYSKAHEKYRLIRYRELREITNSIWVSETLTSLGFEVTENDPKLKAALNIFFQDYIDSLELRQYAEKLLKKATKKCKLGLISNFTYAPVVQISLEKLGIRNYFDAIVVSGNIGWRKPHKRIFLEACEQLQIDVEDAIFIGDSPLEDMKGACDLGMKTVFVHSQFFNTEDLEASGQKPNFVVEDLKQICQEFNQITSCDQEST